MPESGLHEENFCEASSLSFLEAKCDDSWLKKRSNSSKTSSSDEDSESSDSTTSGLLLSQNRIPIRRNISREILPSHSMECFPRGDLEQSAALLSYKFPRPLSSVSLNIFEDVPNDIGHLDLDGCPGISFHDIHQDGGCNETFDWLDVLLSLPLESRNQTDLSIADHTYSWWVK